ncbi:MAG: hypothetical protein ABIQ18_13140 [Umezawaea sp.]
MLRHRLITTVLAAGLALATVTAPASASTDAVVQSIEFNAEPGAYPVDGKSGYWKDPEQEVRISERFVEGRGTVLKADGDNGRYYFRLELLAPGGAPLVVGEYTAQTQRPTADQGGLVLISGGLACLDVSGSRFTVERLDRDEAGVVTALDVDVEQHCPVGSPAFRAHLHVGS